MLRLAAAGRVAGEVCWGDWCESGRLCRGFCADWCEILWRLTCEFVGGRAEVLCGRPCRGSLQSRRRAVSYRVSPAAEAPASQPGLALCPRPPPLPLHCPCPCPCPCSPLSPSPSHAAPLRPPSCPPPPRFRRGAAAAGAVDAAAVQRGRGPAGGGAEHHPAAQVRGLGRARQGCQAGSAGCQAVMMRAGGPLTTMPPTPPASSCVHLCVPPWCPPVCPQA